MSIALAPATTFRRPSANMAWASIVAVLVPSPTMSPVFSAAWRSFRAPRFSSGSGVLEIDFLGDGHAVITDDRRAPSLFDQYRLGLRAQGYADGVGELGRATKDFLARSGAEENLFVCHGNTEGEWLTAQFVRRRYVLVVMKPPAARPPSGATDRQSLSWRRGDAERNAR